MLVKSIIQLSIFLLFIQNTQARQIFVSPNGNDNNNGSIQKPFASLKRAREEVRLLKKSGKPITVNIRKGAYTLNETFTLKEEDGGSPEAPITYQNYHGETVSILGSKQVPTRLFKKITQLDILKRIPAHLKDSIYILDLNTFGINHSKPYPDLFNDDGGIIELFVEAQRMPISRYPNEGTMAIKKVIVNGGGQETKKADWADYYGEKKTDQKPPRPGIFEYRDLHENNWVEAIKSGAWIKGFWRIPWQNEAVRIAEIDTTAHTIKLAVPVPGGIGNKYTRPEGNGKEPYWAMNLPEEVDMPGEWAIDFNTQLLYFYPPKPLQNLHVRIADIGQPLVLLENTNNVSLKGLTVEENLGDGISVKGGKDNLIAGCNVRNITKNGIVLDGGYGHQALSNDVSETGAGGIWLRGGDETTTQRIPAHFSVVNNHIYNFSRLTRVYAAGINAGFTGGGGGGHHPAVGMYIAHNAVHGTPHVGVLYGSYDNKFEYNEIFGYCQFSDDMGAFYCYDKYERMGYDTICYNFIHNSPIGDAVYFDNDHPNMQVFGNIIALSSAPKRRGTAYLYKIGSQVKNPQSINCYNNIAYGCNYAYQFVSASLQNNIQNNISVGCGVPYSYKVVRNKAYDTTDVLASGKNMAYENDPGFVDLSKHNFNLKPNSKVFQDLPSFQPIPFEKMGLFIDAYRKKLPTDAEMHRWENIPQLEGKKVGTDILDRN